MRAKDVKIRRYRLKYTPSQKWTEKTIAPLVIRLDYKTNYLNRCHIRSDNNRYRKRNSFYTKEQKRLGKHRLTRLYYRLWMRGKQFKDAITWDPVDRFTERLMDRKYF